MSVPQTRCVRIASSRSPHDGTGSTGWVTTPSTARATQPYRAMVSTAGTGQPAWPAAPWPRGAPRAGAMLVPFRAFAPRCSPRCPAAAAPPGSAGEARAAVPIAPAARKDSRRSTSSRNGCGNGLSTTGAGLRPARSSASLSASMPSRRWAWTGTTGTPSWRRADRRRVESPCDLGHVDHGQRDDDRPAQLEDLADQVEVPLQVVGRNHAEDDVGGGHVGAHVPGARRRRPSRRASGGQAVGAGQVDQDPPVAGVDHLAEGLLDGDAGIVAHPLRDPGERPEEGGLAGVRVADQGDGPGAAVGGGRHDGTRARGRAGRREAEGPAGRQEAAVETRTITRARSSVRKPSRWPCRRMMQGLPGRIICTEAPS